MFFYYFLNLIFTITFDYPCLTSDSCNNNEIFLERGIYKFECWGAQGGFGCTDSKYLLPGGHGSYVSGLININQKTKFYLYIGGKGGDGSPTKNTQAKAGWNGGGYGGIDTSDNDGAGGGGGSTDIRLISGLWNDINSLRSRIMVAAGGSGSVFNHYGAGGGDLNGLSKTGTSFESVTQSSSTTQTNGNAFGIAGNGKSHNYAPSSGGGGGYYGGIAVSGSGSPHLVVSNSGSSYISGHPSCNSISNTGIHTNSPNHFSGYKFYNTTMINGINLQPNYNSETLINGKTNNGAIRITFISNLETNNIRKFNIKFVLNFLYIIFIIK